MAKGDVVLVNCIGATGSVATDFNTKQPIAGQYRHTQTVGGTQYTWKCGLLQITGVVKLVADVYEGREFWRMEGLADSATQITAVRNARAAIDELDWGA